MKKILIYTVTAGSGHNTLAQTLKDSIEKYCPNEAEVKVINLFKEYPDKFKAWLYNDGYIMSVKYALNVYNAVFKKRQQIKKPIKQLPAFIKYSTQGLDKKMLKTIEEFKPDAIFCTHFLPATALSELRKSGKVKIPVATMETDFLYIPFYECCTRVDKFYMLAEEFVESYLKVGYRREQIEVLGFPCKIEAEEATRAADKRLTLLIMSGAGAFTGLYTQIRNLLKADLDIDILLLNGKDERKFKHYKSIIRAMKKSGKLQHTRVENYAFVTNEQYLHLARRADIIVSKMGANSSIEIINLGKVLITTKKLAEQELGNVKYYQKYIDCFFLDKPTDLRDLIASGKFSAKYLENYIKNIRVLQRETVNQDYAKSILNLCDLKTE